MPLTVEDRITQIQGELSEAGRGASFCEDRGFSFDWEPYLKRIAAHFQEEPVLEKVLGVFYREFTRDARGVLMASGGAFDLDFAFARAALNPRSLEVKWFEGSASPSTCFDPMLQAHGWDAETYIIRQNPASNAEAPFVYLLIGTARALLIDTGAPSTLWPDLLHDTVTGLLARYCSFSGLAALPLMVTHTHRHTDHCAGDKKFKGLIFPAANATLGLGGRLVTVLSTPGHSDADFSFYDERTQWLLTGDVLYPGRLYVSDWLKYRSSVAALKEFARMHPVSAILGSHIEMTQEPGKDYAAGATFHPNEHGLMLTVEHLDELHDALGEQPERMVHKDFIVVPVEAH